MINTTELRVKVGGHVLTLSHGEKILYPKTGFSKGDVISYYLHVAPYMLPHLRRRNVEVLCYPGGVDQPMRALIEIQEAPSRRKGSAKSSHVSKSWNILNKPADLVWAANLSGLVYHTSLAEEPTPERPNEVIFVLDPAPPATILDCAEVALDLREMLRYFGLESQCLTTGTNGLHVIVPLHSAVTFDETQAFARSCAELLSRRFPGKVTTNERKRVSAEKVLVDWSYNAPSKTVVAPYSLRARVRPWVCLPLHWSEVKKALEQNNVSAFYFEAGAALKRLKETGDLLQRVSRLKQHLPRPHAGETELRRPNMCVQKDIPFRKTMPPKMRKNRNTLGGNAHLDVNAFLPAWI